MQILRTRYLPLVLAVSFATGCSNNPIYGDEGLVRDRSQDYELATKADRLELPPHLRAKSMQDQLVVPDAGVTAVGRGGDFKVPRPEFFYAESGTENVNLRRMDGEKVILVDEPIADVWRKLHDFWTFNDIQIAYADPRQGVMETDWITLDGHDYSAIDLWVKRLTLQDIDSDTRNKLRMTVRPDPDDYGRTSIRLSHVQFPLEQDVAEINWQEQATDVEYKSDMMFEMLRYLSKASAEPTAQTLLSMQQKDGVVRPLLGRDAQGNPVLKVGAGADQAWELVNEALDKAELDVGTRDQSLGVFYLTYTTTTPVEEVNKMGFFEWLHSDRDEITLNTDFIDSALGFEEGSDVIRYSSRSNEPAAEAGGDVESELSDPNNAANQEGYKIWFGGRVLYVFGSGDDSGRYNAETDSFEHVGRYQLHLNRSRTGVFLSVHTEQGLEAPAVVAEEILWAIKDQMPEQI